ncbi:hypothetical protein A2774_06075 [Candidatus Roizmanbacteria bacterium RIFCSPHIGHO2_01_FULL_39_12c]|uniref:Antitoxin n=1 Tax=Candidatus Roizmanbacteria bacterium RIFCSPHIGHO2_01_FULL_39_12c TaxID=1802031 RepID=A0A1F7G9L2_9BACT|nr:MAG: hypothetical protein A2774_06075 [Candidatus Roizmanbacteria bacterium RIFCSPHIGHO2_01_FULL_39_12c]OGK47253.1 MAG: hypothetical protein A2963_04270 [Candidatus Roizmanbacteria bacterium RIFCSPLOWO2_01_FULL_40_13]
MQYITTTDLRTKTTELIGTLKNQGVVSLIHRSKVVGVIKPVENQPKPFDPVAFDRLIKDLHLPKTTPKQRERIYRKHLVKKYGKGLS